MKLRVRIKEYRKKRLLIKTVTIFLSSWFGKFSFLKICFIFVHILKSVFVCKNHSPNFRIVSNNFPSIHKPTLSSERSCVWSWTNRFLKRKFVNLWPEFKVESVKRLNSNFHINSYFLKWKATFHHHLH